MDKCNSYFINIDSNFRRKPDEYTLSDPIYLGNKDIKFKLNSNLLTFYNNQNLIKQGDLIKIQNFSGKNIFLRTLDDNKIPVFSIPNHTNILKINYKHLLPKDNIKRYVEIIGIKPDIDNGTFLGNIPINLINKKHKIHLELPYSEYTYTNLPKSFFKADPEYFFIKLQKNSDVANVQGINDYTFKLILLFQCGIPINCLNSQNYTVEYANKKKFKIKLDTEPTDTELNTGLITVYKINELKKGFLNPNSYTIELNETYENIIAAQLINILIENPYTMKPDIKELCWQNIDDGDKLYMLEYDLKNITKIEKKISKIKICHQ